MRDLLTSLIERKISIVPIIPGEKRPGEYVKGEWRGMNSWEQFAHRLATTEEIETWSSWPMYSIGLLTGNLTGIIALDFDNRPDIAKEIQAIIPDSKLKKKGAKGYTAFYYYNGEKNHKWTVDGETVLEILSTGRQTLIPPSVHPTGVPYEWIGEATLLNTAKADLPDLTSDHLEAIAKIIEKYEPKAKPPPAGNSSTTGFSSGHIEEVKEALEFISPDDYHLWIKIGMAIYSRFPGQEGFDLWNNWSQKSSKYKPNETPGKWNSFRGVTKIEIASLFYEAQRYGYKWTGKYKHYSFQPNGESEKSSTQDKHTDERDGACGERTSKLAVDAELLRKTPGLPGRIAAWINETSIFAQPALAVGCALACVGALKAHRVRTESNLRTNLYIIGVAPAGSGKGRAMEQVENLLDEAGLLNLFSGEPVSDSAVLKSLRNNRGRRLLQWDEMGLAIHEMTSGKASTHKAAILSLMMKLFSKASGTFRGKEYADHDDKMKRFDINQPCLSVYGASTPSRLYGSLSSTHAVDGFASRLIILETNDPYPKRRKIGLTDVPTSLISDVQAIEKMSTNDQPKGNLDESLNIRPKIIFATEQAEKYLDEAQDYFDTKRAEYGKISEGLDSVWARASEHVLKLSLIVEDSDHVQAESVSWARDLIAFTTRALCSVIVNQIADNEHQRSYNKVLEIIRKAGRNGIARSELYNRTRWLKTYERNDIIDSLIESERIEVVSSKGDTKPSIRYIARQVNFG